MFIINLNPKDQAKQGGNRENIFSYFDFNVHSFYLKTFVSTGYIRLIRWERLLPNATKREFYFDVVSVGQPPVHLLNEELSMPWWGILLISEYTPMFVKFCPWDFLIMQDLFF